MYQEKEEKYFKLSCMYSLGIHVAVFILLLVSLGFEAKSIQAGSAAPKEIIEAVAVDKTVVQKEIQKIKKQEQRKRAAESAKKKQLERLKQEAKERERVAKRNVEEMKLQQKALQKKQMLAKQKAEKELKALKKQQTLAKKRLADLKKKSLKTGKSKKDAVKTEQEKMLAAALTKEQQQLASVHNKIIASEMARYKALILNAIGQHWIMPTNVNSKLFTRVLIRLAPGGVVLDVKVLKGSGRLVLDRSVISAIWKASPLPVPADTALFEKFRELRLTVKPEGILTS